MGTTAALKELETNEIFCEDKIEGPCGPVKGIYARERTFLALKAERLLIRTLVDTLDGEADAKKLGLACKCLLNVAKYIAILCFRNIALYFAKIRRRHF